MPLIIHELTKPKHSQEVTARFREEPLPSGDRERGFLKDVGKLFEKERTGRLFGTFAKNRDLFPFPQYLSDYLERKITFTEFSQRAATLLKMKMSKTQAATGGFLVISHDLPTPEDPGRGETLLACMLTQRGAHAIDAETLSLTSVPRLEMDHLDLATRIRIDVWKDEGSNPVQVIAGRKEVSDYFLEFLGLDQQRECAAMTRTLQEVCDEWMDERSLPISRREDLRQEICGQIQDGHGEADLRSVARAMAPDAEEDFYARAVQAGLGERSRVDQRPFRQWLHYEYKDDDIKIMITSEARRQGRVEYDPVKKIVTLKDVDLGPGETWIV